MTPDLTVRLFDLPALRRQAKENAKEALSVDGWTREDVSGWHDGDPETLWEHVRQKDLIVAYHAALLADPSRDPSRWWMLTEIGRLLGWDCAGNVPHIYAHEGSWAIAYEPGCSVLFCERPDPKWDADRMHVVPLLPYDRDAAVAAILLHLSGAPNV